MCGVDGLGTLGTDGIRAALAASWAVRAAAALAPACWMAGPLGASSVDSLAILVWIAPAAPEAATSAGDAAAGDGAAALGGLAAVCMCWATVAAACVRSGALTLTTWAIPAFYWRARAARS